MRRFARVAAVLGLTLWAGPALAAGPKTGAGGIVIVDDLVGGSAGSVNLGGPCTGVCVSGSLAQLAVSTQVTPVLDSVGAGYFDFHYNFERLVVLAPGENPRPDSASGKSGAPATTILIGQPALFRVFATDVMGNHASTAAAAVVLQSTQPSTLPLTQLLSAGATAFTAIFASSASAARVVATAVGAGGVASSTSSFFGVFAPTSSSPTVTISIPNGSVRSTLGGSLNGTASDPVSVTSVKVAIQRKNAGSSTGPFWDGSAFASTPLILFDAVLGSPGNAFTGWSYAIPDSVLTSFTSYYVLVQSSNSSSNLSVVETTFTFNNSNLTVVNPGDGQGTAAVIPSTPFGCQLQQSSFVFTAGPNGIQPGGFLAVRVPDGWSRPYAEDTVNNPPTASGFLHVASTSPYSLEFNPPQKGNAKLGENWIVYNPAGPGLTPGQRIVLRYTGFPPAGDRALEPQVFATMVQGASAGTLKPIGFSPGFTLQAGAPSRLSFRPDEPFALGPLQTAPTMQIALTDQCGVSTSAASAITVSLSAGQFGNIDPTAQFYQSGGAALPSQQVNIPAGQSLSPGFYYRTSTAGVSFELLLATASIAASFSSAGRYVRVLASSASLSSVSVDTGTVNPGAVTATFTASAFLSPAFINFKVSDPSLRWEVAISTNPTTYLPAVARRFGVGDPGRSLSWNGIVENEFPNHYALPGAYHVLIRLEGGVVEDKTLRIYVPQTASIYGTVKSTGAGAQVFAQGPGTNYGHSAVAAADGSFRIYGLQAGRTYNVVATTGVVVNGQFTRLVTSSNNVTAQIPLVDIGSIPFPTVALLRLSASIPAPAPVEFWGGAFVHNADYSQTGYGTLHFPQFASASDDGASSFGSNSSTWTAIGLLPGTYDIEVNLHQVGISTTVKGVVVSAGAIAEKAMILDRKANVSGQVILPGAPPFGTHLSVHATRVGEKRPSVYGGSFVQAPSSSGPYILFGLDPGSWTVSARAFGFTSTTTAIYISSNADVSGLDLTLGQGGIITGTITVVGDTSQFETQSGTGKFRLFVNAYNPQTFSHTGAEVLVATATTVSSATFAINGVENGTHYVETFFPGMTPARQSVVVAGGAGTASLMALVNNARIFLTVKLPGGPHPPAEFKRVSFYTRVSGEGNALIQDMTAGATVQYYPSSATWQSPPLGAGFASFEALYAKTGMFQRANFQLSNNTTVFHTLDLSGSTHTVSGRVTLTGNISFSSASYGVTVSSVAGLLANAKTTDYCLMGSTAPVAASTFHLELLPVSPFGGALGLPLRSSSGSALGCADPKVPDETGFNSPNPFHAYLAAVNPDGTFQFDDIPPGHYLLRNSADVDGNPANGLELPQLRELVQVSTDVSDIELALDDGVTVSGRLLSPPGIALSRSFAVSLLDARAKPLRTVVATFNNGTEAFYAFDKVADGQYAVRAEDLGFPRLYGTRPQTVKVFGLDKKADDMALVQTGVIKGRLAIQQNLAGGTTRQFLLITNDNKHQVPSSFEIRAIANPWFQGGFVNASPGPGAACGPDGCPGLFLDENDQFLIENVLPGTYDVEFRSHNDPQSLAGGGVALVSSFLPGVMVSEGRTTDIGTFNILAAAQLSGRVFDAVTSSPIANIRMEASPAVQGPRQDHVDTLTDKDGNFTLTGLDPATRYYSVFAAARPEGGGADPLPYEQKVLPSVDISSVTSLTFNLTPAPYVVSGRVVGITGGPPLTVPFGDRDSLIPTPGAVVFLQKVGEIPTRNPVADIEVITAPDGTFTIPALTAGTYRLTAVSVGYSSLLRLVTISTASVNLGILQLGRGGALSGTIRKPDGSSPGQDELDFVAAVTDDLSELLFATLTKDPNTRTVSAYEIGGFRAGVRYRLVLGSARGLSTPDEARGIVFSTTTESRTLDIVLRPSRPFVFAKAKKTGSQFLVQFETSYPLRARTAADDNLAAILSTFSASGTLSQFELFANRSKLTALYTPGIGESSFTLKLNAYTTVADPESLDPVNPEFVVLTTVTFFTGIDGLHRNSVSNVTGGSLVIEGDAGRITIPSGAFQIDASSTIEVTLQLSSESLASKGLTGLSGAAANLAALRHQPAAYPPEMLSALAATPPQISPFSGFYDVLLPLGVRTALSKPVQMCVTYSEGQDPNTLNLYWYNAAANAYILQQDVTGASPVIDTVNRTKCVNVNHFSTFVLFNTGVAVISGNTFTGSGFEAYNFPNPFDLTVKTVSPIHGAANQSVRGTMIAIALPADVSGDASIRIFNVAGERVRTIDLGNLNGGSYYYQAWDGRNDSGRDVASGVYIAQVKVGGRSKFFKMALIK